MGQKVPLLLSTIIALAGGLASNSVRAINQEYWTLDEMRVLSAQLEAEADAACAEADDPWCIEMYMQSKGGEAYRALGNYQSSQILISAINPSTNKIRVIFNEENLMEKHWGAANYISTLKDLCITQYDRNYPISSPEYMHTLICKTAEEDGEDWYQSAIIGGGPGYTEMEFNVTDFAASLKREEYLVYGYTTSSGSSSGGAFIFSDCVSSRDYEDGMECQAVATGDKIAYIPVAVTGDVNFDTLDHAVSSETISDEDRNGESLAINTVSDVNASDAVNTTDGVNATSATTVGANSTYQSTAPNTGAFTAENPSAIELPWWLFVIFGMGALALLWLFWPKKVQKNPKIFQKSIDKKNKVR